MNPKIAMPILRQLPRDSDRPLWRRLLWWTEPVVYELAEPYMYAARINGQWHHLWLPAGFRSDLASTPRISWLLGFRPDGLLLVPGLCHDWYYRHGRLPSRVAVECAPGRWTIDIGDGTRAWGDRMFCALARDVAGLRLPAWIAYIALRLFGGIAWRQNDKYRRAYAESGKHQLQGGYQ